MAALVVIVTVDVGDFPASPCPECASRPADEQHPEHFWTLRKNGRTVDCELQFHGEFV